MAEDYRNDVQNRGKENPEKELVLLDLTHKKRNSAQHSAQTSARRRSVKQTEEQREFYQVVGDFLLQKNKEK